MPSHAFLGFQNPTSTDKRLDTLDFTIGGVLVHREKMVVAGTTDESYASVGTSIPALTDCGLSVRLIGTAAEDAAHTSGDPGLMALAVRTDSAAALATTDGDYSPLQLDANGFLRITLGTALSSTVDSVTAVASGVAAHDAVIGGNPVRIAGSGSSVPKAAVSADGDTVDWWMDLCGRAYVLAQSGVAHDAPVTQLVQPLLGGAYASSALSGVTLVGNADLTRLMAGLDGVQIVRPHCNLEDILTGDITVTDGSCTTLIAAPGAGLKAYLTTATFSNTCSTAVTVQLKNAGVTVHTVPVKGSTSGATVTFPVPLPGVVNGGWGAHPSAAASSVFISAVGFRSRV